VKQNTERVSINQKIF